MGRINLGRVLVGGFVAGVLINLGEIILNGVLLGEEMEAAMAALNRPPITPQDIVWFIIFGFGFGFILVWTYAAMRPRFGAGIGTAICAASLCWGLGYLYPNLFFYVMNLFPRNMIILTTLWGLVEVVIAGIAGAWFYKEA